MTRSPSASEVEEVVEDLKFLAESAGDMEISSFARGDTLTVAGVAARALAALSSEHAARVVAERERDEAEQHLQRRLSQYSDDALRDLLRRAHVLAGHPADGDDQSDDARLGREFIAARYSIAQLLNRLDEALFTRPPMTTWRGKCGHLWDRAVEDTDACPRCAAESRLEEARKALGKVAALAEGGAPQHLIATTARAALSSLREGEKG